MLTIFQNDGIIDVVGIKTFGVNAKESENPIGYFGTGLKYAIAVILREGGTIDLYRGTVRHHFSVKEMKSRGKAFNVICMDYEPLGFTTDLGKNWTMQQAYRELYCNAIDEVNGKAFASTSVPQTAGKTTIVVNSPAMLEAYHNRNAFILSTAPFITGRGCDVHVGNSKHIFYRGIAVHELEHLSKFTYNITQEMGLTEDRTLKNAWEIGSVISNMVVNVTDAEFLREWLLNVEDTLESKIEFHSWAGPGKPFMDVLRILIKSKDAINSSAAKFFTKAELVNLSPDEVSLNAIERRVLDSAIAFCTTLGYTVEDFPIVVVDTLGPDVYGEAAHRKIFLSRRAFSIGTKCVAGTLMEEWVHLKFRYQDCTRALQNYLVDQVITMGERILGEPL